jgi:hypothetical protein
MEIPMKVLLFALLFLPVPALEPVPDPMFSPQVGGGSQQLSCDDYQAIFDANLDLYGEQVDEWDNALYNYNYSKDLGETQYEVWLYLAATHGPESPEAQQAWTAYVGVCNQTAYWYQMWWTATAACEATWNAMSDLRVLMQNEGCDPIPPMPAYFQ